jgi:hypothetical protein
MRTIAAPPRRPTVDADVLIEEARRRQRRRYAATALTIVVVLAGTWIALGQDRGSRRPAPTHQTAPGATSALPHSTGPIPVSVNTTLLMWPVGPEQSPGIYVDNLRDRRLHRSSTPFVDPGEFQPMMPVGRWLVYVAGGRVMAIDSSLHGNPRLLGRTGFFAPSAVPGHIWLQYGFLGSHRPVKVRSVSIASERLGPSIRLPDETSLYAGTARGFLLRTVSSMQLWNPGTKPRTLPHSRLAQGLDVSARLVAYDTGCRSNVTLRTPHHLAGAGFESCQTLRVVNVVNGTLRSYPAPAGTAGWQVSLNSFWRSGAIAPTGTKLAAEALLSSDRRGEVQAFVVPLDSPRPPTAVPSSTAFLDTATAWSADGKWLFYQGPGHQLWGYATDTGAVRSSATACCEYTTMAPYSSSRPPG